MEVIFKGVSSYEYGLKVRKRPPIPKSERNVEKIEIPGRHGFITSDDETYIGISIPVEFLFTGMDVPTNARAIKQWLVGSGDLIFSDDPNVYYKAAVYNQFDIESAIKNFGEFVVIFDCQPHSYDLNNDIITLTGPNTLFNPGTAPSEPVVKIYGNGDITLTINGVNIYLYNVVDYVTIDSVLMDAYKDTVLKNNDMLGDFPKLNPGENSITWTGTVTKLEITPNWRWS